MAVAVDGLAVIGFTALVATVIALIRKRRLQSAMAKSSAADALREQINERADREERRVTQALKTENPASDLAKLGNQRRG